MKNTELKNRSSAPAPAEERFGGEDFRKFVQSEMKTWNVPGAAVAIVKDETVIFSGGFGYRDMEKGLEVTPETIFPIASCTKTFNSFAVGLLVDENRLEWDRPAREYYPDLRFYDDFTTGHITLRDMLCHRSGLPRHDKVWLYAGLSRKDLMARIQYLQPSCGFRETFQYNNIVYALAGVIVEKISGMPWEDFVRTRILQPLGMENSSLFQEEMQRTDNFAFPYRLKTDDPMQPADEPSKFPPKRVPFQPVSTTGPSSSVNSTVLDMAKWIMLHINRGKFGGKQLVTETTMHQMHSPQMATGAEGEFKAFLCEETPLIDYGLGWVVQPYRGHYMLNHSGGIDGFSSMISFMPREKIGVVVLTNMHTTMLPFVITYNVYDRLLGLEQVDRSTKFITTVSDIIKAGSVPSGGHEKLVKNAPPTHPLGGYTGIFSEPAYGDVVIGTEGGCLEVIFRNTKMTAEHLHYDTFRTLFFAPGSNFEMRITFLMDEHGDIDRLSIPLQTGVDDIVFRKRPLPNLSK
jgi:CubicO group peptidase (beta-lactamase class C family)